MEFDEIFDADSYKLFKLSVEFLYEKNLRQFIRNHNEYKSSVFCLKNDFLSFIENKNISGIISVFFFSCDKIKFFGQEFSINKRF